ncbi:MAG: YfhO family protein [Bacilli bacterium]|nr:YfhO family protein [Bacilli bacterium]
MINKIKTLIQNNLIILLTIITGLVIISLIYYLQEVAPFGSNSLLQIDFFHQYAPMLGEYYDRVKNGLNLVYSFNSGLGLPFFRNFLNYLSSPFNLIILLFDRSNLIMSFSIIIGLKAVVASTTMVYFLSKKFAFKNLTMISLAILYGFSAYFTAYYWNIMWLDGMVFLPLITLGIENIINKNKFLLYILSLALMIISNYFIAYMICIFSVLYFITYLIIKTEKYEIKNILKKCLSFGIASILSAGLTAILILPLFLGINSISATSDSWPTSQYYAFTFWEFLANHFSGVGSTVLASGVSNAANISTGILSIALLFLFIINPKIKLKIKVSYLFLLLILVLSFFLAPLDFIWHGFHVPNDLPYRYSFIYSFILIIISAYSLYYLKYIKVKFASIVYLLLMTSISLLYFLKYENINNSMILLNFLLITLYYILYILYKKYPKTVNKIPYLMILLIILECSICINNNWENKQVINNFYKEYDTFKDALEFVEKDKDNPIYRIEQSSLLTLNDPSWYGYYGQKIFSSMAYKDVAILQNNLGMPGNKINSYYYKQNTPIYDLMFNIKYFIGNTQDINRYNLFYNKNGHLIFKNNFDTNIMYAVNNNIHKWEFYKNNPFYIQNDFIEKTTGIDNVLEKLNFINKELIYDENNKVYKYTFNNPKENMYFYIDDHIDFIIVNDNLYYHNEKFSYAEKIKGINLFEFINLNENYIISTRSDNQTYSIYVGYNNYTHDDFYAYYINNNKFKLATSILNNQGFKIDNFKEKEISGHITLKSKKVLYTSIPFDKGWKVYANSELIDTFKINNSLLGFELKEGKYNIVLKFIPYGMKTGGIISITSFIVIIAIAIKKNKKSN